MTKILHNKNYQHIFSKVNISFSEIEYKNIFINYRKLIKDTIKSKYFFHLKGKIENEYSEYLDYELGKFIYKLKNDNNILYKKFLNNFGDKTYSKFWIDDKNILDKKGLYLFCVNNDIMYIGKCVDNFKNRIDIGYGNISPRNCFLGGQSTNCRINYFITLVKNNIELYILTMENIEEINKLEKILIKKYKPKWNIQK